MRETSLSESERESNGTTLYENHAPMLYRYIYHQIPQPQDAEDILLEVFTIALGYKGLPRLAPQKQLAWLQAVARRKIIDVYRHQSHIVFLPLQEVLDILDREITPEEYVLRQETYHRLYATLTQLPLKQQQLIQLRYGHGLRFAEIAELLKQPEGTLRKNLFRILRQLRAIYIHE